MHTTLKELKTKPEIDVAIQTTKDKLSKAEYLLSNYAVIYYIRPESVPIYTNYFEVVYVPSTVFFFNCEHITIKMKSPDNSKYVGPFVDKQDLIDLAEVVYKAGKAGKNWAVSPIPDAHLPRFDLLYKGYYALCR